MTWSEGERLYDLLPAVHRIRDGDQAEPLRALLSVIESELEIIEADVEGLYDNWFIETCDSWVIPYIGDLVGNRPLHETERPRRADVAKTIHFRRRKATAPMLADLAGDVTGWDTQVVEFFGLLAWTQNVNHPRLRTAPNPLPFAGVPPQRRNPSAVDRVGTVHVRHLDLLDRLDGPFDGLSHTIDVRPACCTRDRYNLRKIGFFIWRLESYQMEKTTPAKSPNAVEGGKTFGFHVSPVGANAPLFNYAKTDEIESTPGSQELSVGGPIRPLALHHDLQRCRAERMTGADSCSSDYVDSDRSLWIEREDDTSVPPEKIAVMDLEEWERPPPVAAYNRGTFSIDSTSEFVSELDDSEISVDLRKAFGAEGFPLPDAGATVSVETAGSQWKIEVPNDYGTTRYKIGARADKLKVQAFLDVEIEAGIDVRRGRLVFAEGHEPEDLETNPDALTVTHFYGFSADLGGGPYSRRETLAGPGDETKPTWSKTISRQTPDESDFPDLDAALLAWAGLSAESQYRKKAVLTIIDNATYELSSDIVLGSDEELIIQADDGNRPTVRVVLDSEAEDEPEDALLVILHDGGAGDGGALTLNGLLIEGGIDVQGLLRELRVIHATLVPGRRLDDDGNPAWPEQPAIEVVTGNSRLELTIDHSIVGPLRLPDDVKSLKVSDSIVDAPAPDDQSPFGTAIAAPADADDADDTDTDADDTDDTDDTDDAEDQPGPVTELQRVTVFGKVNVKQLSLASEVIFTETVLAQRRQEGCVRFSFVPPGSVTPRRYRCQPDSATAAEIEESLASLTEQEMEEVESGGDLPEVAVIEAAVKRQLRGQVECRMAPGFVSTRYGDPAYAQLRRATPIEIRAGAEDGSEMGVFATLRQPQRESNLRQRLDEYLPFGLEAAVLFVT